MYHVHMCDYCGEKAVAFTYDNGDGYCSMECNYTAHQEMEMRRPDVDEAAEFSYAEAEYDAWLSQYDDDPSPYSGTYSEE